MLNFISTILLILTWWLILYLVFSGIGSLVYRLFGQRLQNTEAWMFCFWLGWASTVAVLQLWHLWLKIDSTVLLLVALTGTVGLILNRKQLRIQLKGWSSSKKITLLLILLAGFWFANHAMAEVKNQDTGLYHLTSVKWINTYPVVTGLGNLHGRLAFNSAFFLYAAMLETDQSKAVHLANGLLLFVLTAQTLFSLYKLYLNPKRLRIFYLFNSLLPAPILIEMLGSGIPGLSTDLPIFIISILLASQILFLLSTSKLPQNVVNLRLVGITLLAVIGVTIKVSFVVYAATSILAAMLVWKIKFRNLAANKTKRTLAMLLALAATIIVIWIIRGIILSGYILYPNTVGGNFISVAWQIPRPLVIDEANWAYSWARTPGIHWGNVLGNWDWMIPWLGRLPMDIIKSLIISFSAAATIIVSKYWKNLKPDNESLYWLFFMPPVLSLIFWFATTPHPRFAKASFWILAAGLTTLATAYIYPLIPSKFSTKLLNFAICATFFLFVFPARMPPPLLVSPHQYAKIRHTIPQANYQTKETDSGLTVYLPATEDQCWDAPLPCTPYFRPNLRLIRPNDLGSGFILDRTLTFANMHSTVPDGFVVSPDLGVTLVTGWHFLEEQNLYSIQSPGKLLIYTEKTVQALIALKPHSINIDGRAGHKNQLQISLNNQFLNNVDIQTDTISTISLNLQPGFNLVSFKTLVENQTPIDSRDNPVSVIIEPPKITIRQTNTGVE